MQISTCLHKYTIRLTPVTKKKHDLHAVSVSQSCLGLYTGTRYQHRTEYRFANYWCILVSIFNGMLIGILQITINKAAHITRNFLTNCTRKVVLTAAKLVNFVGRL